MTYKINLFAAAPVLMNDWLRTTTVLAEATDLEPILSELVRLRASQINGCANCVNLLPVWREAPCYTDRERAALGWTEALTRLSEGHGHAGAYGALKVHFTEEEQIKLTLAINIINGWNRVAAGFGLWVEPARLKAVIKAAA